VCFLNYHSKHLLAALTAVTNCLVSETKFDFCGIGNEGYCTTEIRYGVQGGDM